VPLVRVRTGEEEYNRDFGVEERKEKELTQRAQRRSTEYTEEEKPKSTG
jgi:hypothetical protein